MRDFYDIYEIAGMEKIDVHTLHAAFLAKISEDDVMAQMWERFRKKNYFVGELQWEEVSGKVIQNIQEIVVEKS